MSRPTPRGGHRGGRSRCYGKTTLTKYIKKATRTKCMQKRRAATGKGRKADARLFCYQQTFPPFFASHTSLKKPMLLQSTKESLLWGGCAHKKLQDKNFCRIFTIAAADISLPQVRTGPQVKAVSHTNKNINGGKQICAIPNIKY